MGKPGWGNAQSLPDEYIVRVEQRRQNLPLSPELKVTPVCDVNLDTEMETGTGKTYCYIKTMFELNRDYGWSKFIVVVPSIAIREGVWKSFEIMAEHFLEQYGKRARCFIYNSKAMHNIESFSSDGREPLPCARSRRHRPRRSSAFSAERAKGR